MNEKPSKPNCYECKYRGNVPGSAHSCCRYPGTDTDIFLGLFSDQNVKMAQQLKIVCDAHGFMNGWFNWPVDFDPVWLRHCEGIDP